MRNINYFIVFFTCLILSGCATMSPNNFGDVELSKPLTTTYNDPDADIGRYSTFTIFTSKQMDNATPKNKIEEKHILYFIKNLLYIKGYTYVSTPDSADFIIYANYNNEYKTVYVPPSEITLPKYIPERKITIQSEYSGLVDDIFVYGTGTEVTTEPSKWTSEKYTIPGQTVGNYYPSIGIYFYDSRSLNNVWYGFSVAYTDLSDIRISSQFLAFDIIGKVPFSQVPLDHQFLNGDLGTRATIMMTTNGNDYYPTIQYLHPKGPAARAGLLRFDQIVAINNVTTRNIKRSEYTRMLDGKPGDFVELTIWRRGQILQKKLKYVVKLDK